jgi:hypothetical protein
MLAGLFTRIRYFTNQIDQTVAEALNLIKSGMTDVSGATLRGDISGSSGRYIDMSGSNMRISFDVSGSRLQRDASSSRLVFPYVSEAFDISGQNYTWTTDASGSRAVFLPQTAVFDISGQNYTWTTDASGSRIVHLPQTNTTTFYGYTPSYYGGNTTVVCSDWTHLSNSFAALDVSGGSVSRSCSHNNNSCVCVCAIPAPMDQCDTLPSTTCILNRVPTASTDLEDQCCGRDCQQPKKICCFPFRPECKGCWRGSCEICMQGSSTRTNTIDCECPTSPVCGPDLVTKGGCPCYPDAGVCPKDGTGCCSNDIEEANLLKTD